MENLTSVQLNRGKMQSNPIRQRIIFDVAPTPQYRNLSYVDSRYVGLINPYALLDFLPEQISKPKNLEYIVNKNPHLKKLLDKYGLKLNNDKGSVISIGGNLPKSTDNHMKETARIASRICDELGKKGLPVDKLRVIKAARLHDLGKIFIPRSILNKPEGLTGDEKQVMDIHSELSYQLLKTFNIDEKTLELIRNHHNCHAASPIEQQIVSIADVYSALSENRSYKKSLPKEQTINIIEQSGFSKEVVDALKRI